MSHIFWANPAVANKLDVSRDQVEPFHFTANEFVGLSFVSPTAIQNCTEGHDTARSDLEPVGMVG